MYAFALRISALIGFLFPIAYILVITILGLTVEGYSPISSSMSELGAVDSPVRHLANFGGFMLIGIGLFFFAYAFYKSFKPTVLSMLITSLILSAGVFMFMVSFFPCDSGCIDVTSTSKWHSIISTPPAILLPIAAMLSSRLFYENKQKFSNNYQFASFWLGLLSLMSGPLLLFGGIDDYAGLVQRLGIGCSLLWVSVISHKIMKSNTKILFNNLH